MVLDEMRQHGRVDAEFDSPCRQAHSRRPRLPRERRRRVAGNWASAQSLILRVI
jgi:hypothetical protein